MVVASPSFHHQIGSSTQHNFRLYSYSILRIPFGCLNLFFVLPTYLGTCFSLLIYPVCLPVFCLLYFHIDT
ncbi:hypothetical protein EDC04DRAFT_2701684 [Pisolithus marmoratus]|nr:hypothetical protein EDC04DRAFT_2701684 [Pisolithus marmoratus]